MRQNPARYAEKAQAALDKAIVKMLPEALQASSSFVAAVEAAISKATSFDELQDLLVDLAAPAMTPRGLENFLACAMTAAAGYGALAVEAEADGE